MESGAKPQPQMHFCALQARKSHLVMSFLVIFVHASWFRLMWGGGGGLDPNIEPRWLRA